jgi:16S rRNA A1518/A1519 N6-dimethyltransferase RsmA/KsgA/DIM1 with predicted DNA glycosylase/AP lyase activity
VQEANFFETIKRGFAQKRKLLKSNLGPDYAEALAKAHVPEKARAEDLSLPTWLQIAKH